MRKKSFDWLKKHSVFGLRIKQSIAPNMKGNFPLPLKQQVDDKLIDLFNMQANLKAKLLNEKG